MEYPILFNKEMIRAIMAGRKTQTRRPAKQNWIERIQAGNKLYVRETCALDIPDSIRGGENAYLYRADYSTEMANIYKEEGFIERWIPSIHMPEEAIRLYLEVQDVIREPLSAMTEQDGKAEGFFSLAEFLTTWQEIYHDESPNQEVDVIHFLLIDQEDWLDYYNQL